MKLRITDYFTGLAYLAIALLTYLYPSEELRNNGNIYCSSNMAFVCPIF